MFSGQSGKFEGNHQPASPALAPSAKASAAATTPGFHDDTKCTGTSAAITARKNFTNCASSFVICESGSPSLHQARPFLDTAHSKASALLTFCAPTSIRIHPRCTSDKPHCSRTTNAVSKQRRNSSLWPASRLCSTICGFMRQRNQEHINGFNHRAPAMNQRSLPISLRRSVRRSHVPGLQRGAREASNTSCWSGGRNALGSPSKWKLQPIHLILELSCSLCQLSGNPRPHANVTHRHAIRGAAWRGKSARRSSTYIAAKWLPCRKQCNALTNAAAVLAHQQAAQAQPKWVVW